MEEICRMNDCIFENNRKISIKKISRNYEILPNPNGFLQIYRESVETSFARAEKLWEGWRGLTIENNRKDNNLHIK